MRFLLSYWRVLVWGRFAHRAYAERYLGSKYCFFFALAHYVVVGEKRGFRPNAFFDPKYFIDKVGDATTYATYLTQVSLWAFSTSHEFQAGWYCDLNAGDIPSFKPPLIHFLDEGFARCLPAGPNFDTRFFRHALAKDDSDAMRLAFRELTADSLLSSYTSEGFVQKQKGFLDAITLQQRRALAVPRRRRLAFVQAGRSYDRRFSESRSFDVLINLYEPSLSTFDWADYVFYQRGTKCTAVSTLLAQRPGLLTAYDAVLLLDDDVAIDEQQIERLFEIQSANQTDLLQASLSARSTSFFPYLKQPHAGAGLRSMTAVEIMMPVISRRVMEEFGAVFALSVSGWGLDLLLGKLVRERFGETVALAGDVVCEHLRGVDLEHGQFYRNLREAGLKPCAEAGLLAARHKLNDKGSAIRPLDIWSCDNLATCP